MSALLVVNTVWGDTAQVVNGAMLVARIAIAFWWLRRQGVRGR